MPFYIRELRISDFYIYRGSWNQFQGTLRDGVFSFSLPNSFYSFKKWNCIKFPKIRLKNDNLYAFYSWTQRGYPSDNFLFSFIFCSVIHSFSVKYLLKILYEMSYTQHFDKKTTIIDSGELLRKLPWNQTLEEGSSMSRNMIDGKHRFSQVGKGKRNSEQGTWTTVTYIIESGDNRWAV